MNYELAQELKDAGFPNITYLQHRQGREFILPDGSVPVYSLGDAENVKDWFIPILEELIEACGEKFDRLVAYHDKGAWDAASKKDSDGFFKSASGKTPAEAVARLWLALHNMTNEANPGQDRPTH
jgi:hypothetical protein